MKRFLISLIVVAAVTASMQPVFAHAQVSPTGIKLAQGNPGNGGGSGVGNPVNTGGSGVGSPGNGGGSGVGNPGNGGGSGVGNPGNGNTTDTSGQTLVNPLKVNDLKELLKLVVDAIIQLGSIVLVLMLIWCGFLFVAARGNEEQIRTARTALMWTIIGGLILLGAKGIETVIESTVNGL